MRHGLSFLPDATPSEKSAADYFGDAMALAVEADRAGLASVKMTEHYLRAYGGYCPSPLAFLAAVAARTQRVRLITGCILPAFHHPLQIAAETAMVDALSAGRLEVGFARAYLPYEFDAFRVPLDESRERYEAAIRAVLALWTHERVTMETPFFAFVDATSLPRPTQRPHPPVWAAAVRSRQSFAWIGEQGFRLLVTPSFEPLDALADRIAIYREAFCPREPGATPHVAISLPLFIADSPSDASAEGEHFLARYLDTWADAAESWHHVKSGDYPGYTGMAYGIRSSSPDRLRRQGNVVIGSPDEVVDRIAHIAERLAVQEWLWQVDFGAMPLALSRRTVVHLTEHVLPRLGETARLPPTA
jgi:alkanesulfonate monooxygenase SsuD/methylene tetrahydromethanopterin reductase-like flavin-dependent oxidoreductase (luciferase family)